MEHRDDLLELFAQVHEQRESNRRTTKNVLSILTLALVVLWAASYF